MENITNQVLELGNDDNYFIIRQAVYRGVTYYFAVKITKDEEDITDEFTFLERIENDGTSSVRRVTDKKIIEVLCRNIKLDNIE